MMIQTKGLPLQIILALLQFKWPSNVRVVVVGFLDLMVKENVAANAKKFMETPEALKAMLLCFDRDAANPVCQTWASALLRMATEEDANDVRVGVANADLSVLVKFVLNHGTVKHKELLTTMLALLCRNATVVEEAVINAEELTFMLKSLPKNSKTQGDVLEAGFVEIAMGSTNQEFASTQVALALADICSIPAGLEKIVACPRSVEALLQLLEFCPTTEGKAAAAVVIRTLFIWLCLNEDSTMQVTMTEACSFFLFYIQQEDQQSQVKVFLEALVVFAATGSKGRERIHEERGERTLMLLLKSTGDTEVRDLVLRILAEMSNGIPEGMKRNEFIHHKILNVFLQNEIGKSLCRLLDDEQFKRRLESMETVLILVNNLSLAGPGACAHLSENGAVKLLLNVLRVYGSSLSPVTKLAARALLNLINDPIGKKEFLNDGEIEFAVAVLKLEPWSSGVKNVASRILTSVAEDPETGKGACKVIFKCDILPTLTTRMYNIESSKSKWQAARLAKLLATNGPTQKVCVAMCKAGTLEALNDLRSVKYCSDVSPQIHLRNK